MSNNSWFKLALRAIGVYSIIAPASKLLEFCGWLISDMLVGAPAGPVSSVMSEWIGRSVAGLVVFGLQLGVSVYLIAGAPGFVRWCLRESAGRCPGCDYDISGLKSSVCPECNMVLPGGAEPAPESKGTTA